MLGAFLIILKYSANVTEVDPLAVVEALREEMAEGSGAILVWDTSSDGVLHIAFKQHTVANLLSRSLPTPVSSAQVVGSKRPRTPSPSPDAGRPPTDDLMSLLDQD